MKILNKEGKRLFFAKSPDPDKIPNVEIWAENQKDCIFCKNCSVALDLRNPKRPRLQIGCQLPCVAASQNNCNLHNKNKNHTCTAFEDIEQDEQTAYVVERPKETKKPELLTFSMNKDGVNIKK